MAIRIVATSDLHGNLPHEFSGRRVRRGLYRSADGTLINADINGAVNILRKYLNERNLKGLAPDRIRALVNAPCRRLNAFAQAPSCAAGGG